MFQRQLDDLRHQMRTRAFCITVIVYLLVTAGIPTLLDSPPLRSLAEQNSTGLLQGYFSRYAGYDVTGAVIRDLSKEIFLWQQVLALLLVLALWRRHRAVAIGILVVLFSFAVVAFCLLLIFLLYISSRRGY